LYSWTCCVQLSSISFIVKSHLGPDPQDASPFLASQCGNLYQDPFSPTTRVRPYRYRSSHGGRMISSCPNYLHADVSDGEDLSRHQQEDTGGQRVTMSLVPGTVDSNASSECHLCCTPPLPTEELSILGRQVRTLCLETELEKSKKKSCVSISLSVPLDKVCRVRTGCSTGRLFYSV